jgi:electron transport complex protein RnfC
LGKSFRGGIHPADEKERTAGLAIEVFPVPDQVAVLLSQHIGAPCKPVVAKGDEVRTGQIIGEPQGFISAPIHSSVTGKVAAIEDRPSSVTGVRTPAVVIERAGDEVWADGTNVEQDVSALTPAEVRERVLAAGIVGMGGATFPTHVKISPPPDQSIDTAVLNGAECEPHLNCDNRLMIEKPKEVVEGFRLILRALNCTRGIIALESNKPAAYAAMREAAAGDPQLTVERLHVKYPQGAEHQLIKALLGREIPWRGGLPMAVGALVQNVATAFAVRQAVRARRPLIERVLTVTGDGVERPGNFLVRVGTSVRLLLDHAGVRPGARKLVFGGPMMGIAQRTSDIPTTKGTSGILVLMNDTPETFGPCIRCGRCLCCPYGLTPAMISRAVEAGNIDAAQEWNVLECKECGCCTYVCPAKRPIVQQAKIAKAELARRRAREKERAK